MVQRQLTPETQAAIREAVDQIAKEHGLSDETHAELTAHLEDKALAYVAGDEPISEADALLLARHHLGNPKSLGLQLAVASPKLAWLPKPLMERLVFAAITLFTCNALASFLHSYILLPIFVVRPFHFAVEHGTPFNAARGLYGDIILMTLAYIPFPFFLKWLESRRQAPSPRLLLLILATALLLNTFAASRPGIFSVMAANAGDLHKTAIINPSVALSWAFDATHLLGSLVIFGIWLRYSCRAAATVRNLAIASLGWFLAMALNSVAYHFGVGIDKAIHFGFSFPLNPAFSPVFQILNDLIRYAFQSSAPFVVMSLAIQVPCALGVLLIAPRLARRSIKEVIPATS